MARNLFSERLSQLRIENELKREDVAKVLNCSVSAIGNYENGNRTPDFDGLIILAELFNTTTDYLLGLSDVKATDKDINFICKFTGLSEQAIKILQYSKENYVKSKEKYNNHQQNINEVLDITNALLEWSPFGIDEIAFHVALYKHTFSEAMENRKKEIETCNSPQQFLDALVHKTADDKVLKYKFYDIQESFRDFINGYTKRERKNYEMLCEKLYDTVDKYKKDSEENGEHKETE